MFTRNDDEIMIASMIGITSTWKIFAHSLREEGFARLNVGNAKPGHLTVSENFRHHQEGSNLRALKTKQVEEY